MNVNLSIKNLMSFEKNRGNMVMLALTAMLLIIFGGGVLSYLIQGHDAYNVGREHPWGILLTVYVFWAIACTGLCLISSLGHVLGLKEFDQIGKRAVAGAIIFVLTAFLVIALELGHPFRIAIYNVISPGFRSAIWWMGTLYGAYLFILIIEFFMMNSKKHQRYLKFISLLALFAGIAANSNLASVFALLVARPYINTAYFPISFILVTMICGAFMVYLIYGFKHKLQFPPEMAAMLRRLAKILFLLLIALIFFEFWRVLSAVYGDVPERAATVMQSLKAPSYWGLEILLGIVLPLLMLLIGKAKSLAPIVLASLGGVLGIFFMRYNMIHNVFIYPMDTMMRTEYAAPKTWVQYSPSLTELAIALGSIGVVIALYYLAEKVFNLDE